MEINNESVLYIKVKRRKCKLNKIETVKQSLSRIKGVYIYFTT